MSGLFERDYTKLTTEEEAIKEKLVAQRVAAHSNITFHPVPTYPEPIRYYMSLFPNNYMDPPMFRDKDELEKQCDMFEELLNNKSITELDIKHFIQDNRYYHIPASILERFYFGHHEAALFKEFPLGTSYKADYLLLGASSDGWKFVFVEFENPYGDIIKKDEKFGNTIRKGINQIDDWKGFVEGNYSCIKAELEKCTTKDLPRELTSFDSTRMNYAVVAGRRNDFSEKAYSERRRTEQERKIIIFHYDNLLDMARRTIDRNTTY